MSKKEKQIKIVENTYDEEYISNFNLNSSILESIHHQGRFEIIEFCAKIGLLGNEVFCKVCGDQMHLILKKRNID